MLGTETYGTSGTISGGSDSFTWDQSATDILADIQDSSQTTGTQTGSARPAIGRHDAITLNTSSPNGSPIDQRNEWSLAEISTI